VPPIYDLAAIVRARHPLDAGPLADYATGRLPLPELPLPPVPSPRDDSPDALQVGSPVPPEHDEPWPGAPRLLRWRTRIILQNGQDQRHPLSNKVEVTFRLRDVAASVGLNAVGVAWIKALVGPRYVCDTAPSHSPWFSFGCWLCVCSGMRPMTTPCVS